MTARERAEQLWETWKKATFVASTRTIHAENYIQLAEQAINAAVAEEREACAKIVEDSYDAFTDTQLPFAGPALLKAAKQIRARSTAPTGGTK